MKNEISIDVNGVSKIYHLYANANDRIRELFSLSGNKYYEEYYALNNINFTVNKGETFGIIGTNGAGKSTLLKLITGVSNPTEGNILVKGKVSALLELGSGFNKNYTGIENIYLNGTMMGISRGEMEEKIQPIIEFADIGDFINQPVKTYSSGMFARLAFAVAINIEPEVLIVDEALSVGDVFFQNKCYKKFEELRNKGITVIFVSHDIGTVQRLCSRVLWLEHGRQMMLDESTKVCREYTNSILSKRSKEYNDDITEKTSHQYIQKGRISKDYPKVTYTNESILSDELEILSVILKDDKMHNVSAVEAGKNYTLSIIFKSKRDINDCIAGFVLETSKGLWVINCNTLNSGIKRTFSVTKNTDVQVDFNFCMPAIVNGDYVVGVAVSEGTLLDFKVISWLYNVLYVQMTNVGGNDSILQLDTSVDIFEDDNE